MTLEQFLVAFEEFGPERRWLIVNGCIRTKDGRPDCDCPISAFAEAVTGIPFNTIRYVNAGKELGLTRDTARRIARAADKDKYHSHAIRERLLKACNLEEKANV